MKASPSPALLQQTAEALAVAEEVLLVSKEQSHAHDSQEAFASTGNLARTVDHALTDCVTEQEAVYETREHAVPLLRAIEEAHFPFEHFSEIAELESWRKEVNRPVYHIHKWWAQRLGSVFRAILLATVAPAGSDVLKLFYQRARLNEAVIFDPFMGSGTTIGEALKLGARAIGRDINPVAHFGVRNALSIHVRRQVVETFRVIERDIASTIQGFYQARAPDGGTVDVLYYFWVKVISCPNCEYPVDLFSSYIFAKHAYPARYPEAHALCPHCGAINKIRYDVEHATCYSCHTPFLPNTGPAKGAGATCPACQHEFLIARTVQKRGEPPTHRLYAKMVMRSNGSKDYLAVDEHDLALYNKASLLLKERRNAYPVVAINPGYNTNQALNYCYTQWHQMFNDRQLLCLSLLAERIRLIPDVQLRDLFACLFSGTLEFNNMFASFKGEGTGAVRHMFSHHILKPERMPLEANLWGTPKSSGAFSTLFQSRLLRALDYCDNPFEIGVVRHHNDITSKKIFGLSQPLNHEVATSFGAFQHGMHLYLSCGDSAHTDLAAQSVDAVVTDPPFFDNVHYSQLADFFYVWQCHVLGKNGYHGMQSTRAEAEVQHNDPAIFTERLCAVWAECYRVLRPDGLLVFSYHHSRAEGWRTILEAIVKAGFRIVATHPIKAEMSSATPKQQAKEPIDLDVILVCRKRTDSAETIMHVPTLIGEVTKEADSQIGRFNNTGRRLSRNDVRVILMAHVIKRLSWRPLLADMLCYLRSGNVSVEAAIDQLYQHQHLTMPLQGQERQLALW